MSISTRLQEMQPTDIGVPGPTSLDMARGFRSIRADPLSFLASVSEHYGDLVSFPVPGAPALLLNDPAAVRHVLQTSARSWGKDTIQYAALARVTGPGLLASAEPSWIDHRRLAAPAFHHQRLVAVGEQVRAAARSAVDVRLPAAVGAGGGTGVVDVAALTHTIGLDAVGRALFSADLSGQAQTLLDATSDAAELVVRLGRAILPAHTGRRRASTCGCARRDGGWTRRRRRSSPSAGPAVAGPARPRTATTCSACCSTAGFPTRRSATSSSP